MGHRSWSIGCDFTSTTTCNHWKCAQATYRVQNSQKNQTCCLGLQQAGPFQSNCNYFLIHAMCRRHPRHHRSPIRIPAKAQGLAHTTTLIILLSFNSHNFLFITHFTSLPHSSHLYTISNPFIHFTYSHYPPYYSITFNSRNFLSITHPCLTSPLNTSLYNFRSISNSHSSYITYP